MQWNLDDIYKPQEFYEALAEAEKKIGDFGKLIIKLDPEMEGTIFEKILQESEKLGDEIRKILYYPELREATNQKDDEAKKMKAMAMELYLKYTEIGRKFDHWIKGLEEIGGKKLDNKNAKRLFKVIEDLEYSLDRSRELAKYSLNLKNEEIIDHKDSYGLKPLLDLREILETETRYELEIEGKKIKIETQAELTKLFYSPKREIRKQAYKALLNKHKENLSKYNLVYQARVRDWIYEGKLRGFKSPIAQRNVGNDVSDKTIEVLLRVCRDNRKIFWKFFELKAKKMGLKKLERWDVYSPIGAKDKKMEWEETKKIVLESFGNFWPKFGEEAKRIIEEKHVDVLPKKEKRGGAFCATVTPKITPYVLLNFTGTQRDALVLAHELGHGVHSLMANKHFGSTQLAGLPLAETASTLGELMVFDNLIKNEKNDAIKQSLIWEKLGDAYATILRQNYFVMFEMKAYRAIEKGVTGEELSEIYFQNLKEQFGNSIDLDKNFRYEWAYISHIFESPFYCYAYNFGELLSYSLFYKYKKEGVKWLEKIKKILEAGGSRDPDKLLKEAGIDTEKEEFWQGGFLILKKWLSQV